MEEGQVLLRSYRRPGALATLARAALGVSIRLRPEDRAPNIRAVWEDMHVDQDHLNAYADICDLRELGVLCALFPDWFYAGESFAWRGQPHFLYPLYPLTLVFPLIMRILGHKQAPLTVFRTLNTRLQVTSLRKVRVDETLTLTCETGATRVVPKGFEMDVRSVIHAENTVVWESVHTFYYRGNYGGADSQQAEIYTLSAPQLLGTWYLSDGIGLRFARISGDSNGIHYNSWYARLLGFDRALAQPILVLTRSLNCLTDRNLGAFRLDAFLKGPVYYNSNVFLKGVAGNEEVRFDVYCEDNPRPCLCCSLTSPAQSMHYS